MALEEKRTLEEILIRPNSRTNGGVDGVSLTYRTWVEKDGEEMAGTSSTEGPKPSDWEDPEVMSRIGELEAQLQAQANDLTAQLSTMTAERDDAARALADMTEARDALQSELDHLKADAAE